MDLVKSCNMNGSYSPPITEISLTGISQYKKLLVCLQYSAKTAKTASDMDTLCFFNYGQEIDLYGSFEFVPAFADRLYMVDVSSDSIVFTDMRCHSYQVYGLEETSYSLLKHYWDGNVLTSIDLSNTDYKRYDNLLVLISTAYATGINEGAMRQDCYITNENEVGYSGRNNGTSSSSNLTIGYLIPVSHVLNDTITNLKCALYQVIGIKNNSKIQKLTPKMTSNNTPSGEVTCSSRYSINYEPFYAFDEIYGNDGQTWATIDSLPQWICYRFPKKVCVTRVSIVNRNEGNIRAVSEFILQGSNNGSTWTDIQTCISTHSSAHYKSTFEINNINEYYYYRLYCTGNFNNATGTGCGFAEVELYGVTIIKVAGNPKAIGDWFRATRYVKDQIDEFFVLKNTYASYEVTIKASEGDEITITGQTSLRSYTFKMIGDEVTKLMFFTANETIVASNGLDTQTIVLSDRVFDISFLTTKSIDLVDSYDSKGSHQYTVQENGMYLIIVSTGQAYRPTNASITLPQGRSAIIEDLMNYELSDTFQAQVRYCIADLQVGDVITTEIVRSDGAWNTNLNDIYKLSGIRINSNSSVIKHLERVGDGTASYTPPSDNNYYLEIGVAYATYGNKHNYTDLTGKEPEVVVEEETGYKSLIAFYYGQGNKLPTISMQGYDGGAGIVGCIQI